LSADAFRAEGLNVHCLLFDELHAQRGDRRLWDALRYGGAARRQPLCPISITTAGESNRTHLWYEQHQYAEKCIADPTFDPSFFGCIFAADCREAENSATKLNSFLRYRLNIPTSSDVRWLRPDLWAACSGGPEEPLEGRDFWAGLDLASNYDTTAFVAVFPDGDRFDVVPMFWIPEHNAAERERNDRVPYSQWHRDGFLKFTEGRSTDYKQVKADILEFCQKHRCRKLAIDRWNATQLATELADEGLPVTMFGQGFASMTAPSRRLESLTIDGKLRHAGHPVLNWQAGNVAVQMDPAANIKPSKAKSTERIDGIVSLVMALGVHMGESMKPADLPEISFW
jgi:phage terminase large subunit-like protein